jgi:hypothetical protein
VDEPPDTLRYMNIYNEMTVTEQWLVQCVLHLEVDTDEEFKSDWSEYILLHLLRNNVDLAEVYYEKRVGRAYVDGSSIELPTIREYEFATAFERCIIDAATSPDVDPDGRVAEMIRTSGMAPSPAGSYSSSAFNPPRSIIDDHSLEDNELEDNELEDNELEDNELEDGELEDVQLLPCGRRTKVDDYTDQIVFPPSGMVCTVCYE